MAGRVPDRMKPASSSPEPLAASDEALAARLIAGDQAAFDQLVLRYKIRLYNFILKMVQDPDLAEEITQVPKRRYGAMVNHFLKHGGPRFRDMMRLTAAVQISLDSTSEQDAGRKLRAGTLLAPVAAGRFEGRSWARHQPSNAKQIASIQMFVHSIWPRQSARFWVCWERFGA